MCNAIDKTAPLDIKLHVFLMDYLVSRCIWKTDKSTCSRQRELVASKTTGGAQPTSMASIQRDRHKHQLSPGFKPGKENSGLGVTRSFPRLREYSRKSSVTCAHTQWAPISPGKAQQLPSRSTPVAGFKPQVTRSLPNKFFCDWFMKS